MTSGARDGRHRARRPPRSSAGPPRSRRRAAASAPGRSGESVVGAPGRSGGECAHGDGQPTTPSVRPSQSSSDPRRPSCSPALGPFHEFAHRIGGRGHEGQDAGVVHARRADDAEGAGRLSVRRVGRPDDRELAAARGRRSLRRRRRGRPCSASPGRAGLTSFSRASSAVTSCRTCPASSKSGFSRSCSWPSMTRSVSPPAASFDGGAAQLEGAPAQVVVLHALGLEQRRSKSSRRSPSVRPSTTSSSRLWMRCSSVSVTDTCKKRFWTAPFLITQNGQDFVGHGAQEAQLLEHQSLGARGEARRRRCP